MAIFATYPFSDLFQTASTKEPKATEKLELQYTMGILTRREYIIALREIVKR